MAAHGEKTAIRAKAGDMSSGAGGGERSMRCARAQSSVEDTASGARRQKATWCAMPCAKRDWDAESRPQSDASSASGSGASSGKTASASRTSPVSGAPASRSIVFPILADSFQ